MTEKLPGIPDPTDFIDENGKPKRRKVNREEQRRRFEERIQSTANELVPTVGLPKERFTRKRKPVIGIDND